MYAFAKRSYNWGYDQHHSSVGEASRVSQEQEQADTAYKRGNSSALAALAKDFE